MLRPTALAVAVALAVAGCTGDPTPTTATSPPTTSSTSRPPGVPPVADPIDLRPFYKHPCATLTATQQDQLSLRPRVREWAGDRTGMCKWAREDANHDYMYLLQLDIGSDMLTEAYEGRDARQPGGGPIWELFEPREIHGLPAVKRSFSTLSDQCEVIVDVGNSQSIAISGNLSGNPIQPCATASSPRPSGSSTPPRSEPSDCDEGQGGRVHRGG
jgi:hypothetical protein